MSLPLPRKGIRTEEYLYAIATAGGGGGGDSTLIEKNIVANGTFRARDDNADGYSVVTVDVPAQGIDYQGVVAYGIKTYAVTAPTTRIASDILVSGQAEYTSVTGNYGIKPYKTTAPTTMLFENLMIEVSAL